MKIFQELYIDLQKTDRIFFIEQLEAHLTTGWLRDTLAEQTGGDGHSVTYCFKRAATENWPEVLVCLVEDTLKRLYVSNVFPTTPGQLSYDQYNQILSEFYTNMVSPLATQFQIHVQLTAPEIQLKDYLSESSCQLFKTFSNFANKAMEGLSSLAKKRWFDFILATHRGREPLPAKMLERFLREDGWSVNQAMKLADDYELTRELLTYQEEHHDPVTHFA